MNSTAISVPIVFTTDGAVLVEHEFLVGYLFEFDHCGVGDVRWGSGLANWIGVLLDELELFGVAVMTRASGIHKSSGETSPNLYSVKHIRAASSLKLHVEIWIAMNFSIRLLGYQSLSVLRNLRIHILVLMIEQVRPISVDWLLFPAKDISSQCLFQSRNTHRV